MMRTILFICLIASMLGRLSAQSLVYDIIKSDETMGTMELIRSEEGSQTFYNYKSTVVLDYFFTTKLGVYCENTFEAGRLVEAQLKSFKNDKAQHRISSTFKSTYFLVQQNDQQYKVSASAIHQSMTSLYFNTPLQGESLVFSESYAQAFPIQAVAPGVYELRLPDRSVYRYTYRNGLCTQVEIQYPREILIYRLQPEYLAMAGLH